MSEHKVNLLKLDFAMEELAGLQEVLSCLSVAVEGGTCLNKELFYFLSGAVDHLRRNIDVAMNGPVPVAEAAEVQS